MIIGKSQKEIEKMRASGRLVGQVLQALRQMVGPGITTLEVDAAADKMIRDAGAYPTFKGYNGFPFSICASVNEQIVHGFPSTYELQEGDIFSIDVGVTLEGFVFAVEPMVNMGSYYTKTLKDGWTVVTVDGLPSAHAEHTIAITEDGPEVLTRVVANTPAEKEIASLP